MAERNTALKVTVLRNRYVQSWPNHDQGEKAYVAELAHALARPYSTDAHFAQYVAPNARRLSGAALDCLPSGIVMACIAFDFDCPEAHGAGTPAPETWRADQREKLRAFLAEHGPFFCYETRGGLRTVHAQPDLLVLRTSHDARQWSQDYSVVIAHLARRFDLHADPACADWQRIFRLPRATRDGMKPESWPTLGHPGSIGPLLIEATAEDVANAKRFSKAFAEPRVLHFQGCNGNGFGLLFHALKERGALVREHGSQAYVIRCPREAQHTSGRTGNGSTVLYLPHAGEQIGWICCLHSHCVSLRLADWLREFDPEELRRARCAAGLEGAA